MFLSRHSGADVVASFLRAYGMPSSAVQKLSGVDGFILSQVMSSAPTRIGRTPLEAFFDDVEGVTPELSTKLAAAVLESYKPFDMATCVRAAHAKIIANLERAAPLFLVGALTNATVIDADFLYGPLSEETRSAAFLYTFLMRYLLSSFVGGMNVLPSVPPWTKDVEEACLNYIMFSNRRVLPRSAGMPVGTKIATETHFLGVPVSIV